MMSTSDECFRSMEEGKILSLPSPGGEEKGVLRSPWTESSGSTFTKNFYPSSNVLNGNWTSLSLDSLPPHLSFTMALASK